MPTFNNYDTPAQYNAGSMVRDRNGNLRMVSKQEANGNSFFAAIWMYCSLVPAAAILCWNALVIVCLWWWEAPVRRTWKPPMTRRLMGHPFRLIRKAADAVGI